MNSISKIRIALAGAVAGFACTAHAQVQPVAFEEPDGIPVQTTTTPQPRLSPFSPKYQASARQAETARRRQQVALAIDPKAPTIAADANTIDLTPPSTKTSSRKSTVSSSKVPKLANGKSLEDLNLSEGQVVVLDEKGNIVESYIEGKDGKKTPVDTAKLMRSKAPSQKTADVEKPSRKTRIVETAAVPTQAPTKKPGFFGRLLGRSKAGSATTESTLTTEDKVVEPRVTRQSSSRSVLR